MKAMKIRACVLIGLSILGGSVAKAQSEVLAFDKFRYEINAGLSIGGSCPLPLPAEIRKIESYNPDLNLSLGIKATKYFDNKWGLSAALRFESKGMTTGASVKDYGMEIIQEDSRVKGRWTGKVHTSYHSSQLAIPVNVVYRFNPKWEVEAGPYVAIAMRNEFKGYVHDGYLREGNPTGEKAVFEGDSRAYYDFNDELRTFQWGIQLAGKWMAFRHFAVNANLTWGLNDIFKSSFKTVTFNMYPIFLNLGFGYVF